MISFVVLSVCFISLSLLVPVLVSVYSGICIHQQGQSEQRCIISKESKSHHHSSFAKQSYHLRGSCVQSMALSFLFLHISLSVL